MDLIYTDAERIDQGTLSAYAFDLSFGAEENDFEITLGADEPALAYGACVYIEGTEYGGIVGVRKSGTNSETVTTQGRTWHGILNSKVIQPDSGESHLVVEGDANEVLALLIARLGLSGLFVAENELSGVNIPGHQFPRYCKGYDGIRAMLAAYGAKLKIAWKDRAVRLSAKPVVDYTENPIDGDIATLTVEQHKDKVNHLICLGRGELTAREVVHLYVDQNGKIGDVQYYTGLDEITDVYDNTNAESSADLRKGGIERLTELRGNDKAEISVNETDERIFDIGDIVGAADVKSGVSVAAAVSQKIVRINNGAISTEYQTGG